MTTVKTPSLINPHQVQATINLRLAKREDLVFNKKLMIGVEFYVLNGDGISLSGKHMVTLGTDKEEFGKLYKQKRIYVPVSCIDAPILLSSSVYWMHNLKPEKNGQTY